ncbi:MAG: hypothetical protein KAR55_03730, partial [Thermoplasmatales archaeon]|nr:hypothetical protein [Thermoplasmatales archaeon]
PKNHIVPLFCTITATTTVYENIKNNSHSLFLRFLERLEGVLERFSNLFPILQGLIYLIK